MRCVVEADREGAHGPARAGLHQRHDGRRVHPARQEGAERDVGHHLLRHRIAEQTLQRVDSFVGRAGKRLGSAGLDHLAQVPPAARRGLGRAGAEGDPGSRQQLLHALMDRAGRRDRPEAQQQRERPAVDRRLEGRVGTQGPQLRAEQQGSALPAVVQRFLAQAVARQRQARGGAVPQREGEHAHRAHQRGLQPPGLDPGQQGLGVRGALPARARGLELAPPSPVVVELAVEGQHVPARRRDHGLVARRREVQDRQAAVRQGDTRRRVDPDPRIVRAPVRDAPGHGFGHGRALFSLEAARLEESCQPAHAILSGRGDDRRVSVVRAQATRQGSRVPVAPA